MGSPQITFKICIFGPSKVGKTTLAKRYLTGFFQTSIKQTLGAELFVKFLEIKDLKIVLQIWDFAGEDMFKDLLPAYAQGSSAGIYMFDLSKKETLNKLDEWLTLFKSGLTEQEQDIPILMVGGKKDLEKIGEEVTLAAIDFHKYRNLFDYYECSSKTGENVEAIFEKLTREILQRKGFLQQTL